MQPRAVLTGVDQDAHRQALRDLGDIAATRTAGLQTRHRGRMDISHDPQIGPAMGHQRGAGSDALARMPRPLPQDAVGGARMTRLY